MNPSDPSRTPRPRVARGPARPLYLSSEEDDRMMMIVTALVAEVSVLRDRLDTHEALAAAGLPGTAEAIEAFRPDEAREQARNDARDKMLRRVYRVLMEDLDEARQVRPAASSAASTP